MVRRKYVLTATYSLQLSHELLRIKNWAMSNRKRKNIKQLAMIRSRKAFNKYFNLLLPYIFRTRIIPQLGKNAKQLTPNQLKELERLKTKAESDFQGVLTDALS